MLKEMIDRIVELAKPTFENFNGRNYSSKALHAVETPLPSSVTVHTLTGLKDLIASGIESMKKTAFAIHVESHESVALIGLASDEWGKRTTLARVKLLNVGQFKFGQYMAPEEFIIGLQSSFVPETGDVAYLLSLTSHLSAETVTLAQDNGISQSVTLKSGVNVKESVTVRPRVKLAPFRTFPDIQQPASEFLFRMKSRDGSEPACGLFEADGSKWRLDAVQSIKTWLSAEIADIAVIA